MLYFVRFDPIISILVCPMHQPLLVQEPFSSKRTIHVELGVGVSPRGRVIIRCGLAARGGSKPRRGVDERRGEDFREYPQQQNPTEPLGGRAGHQGQGAGCVCVWWWLRFPSTLQPSPFLSLPVIILY